MKNYIYIDKAEFYAYHGVFPQEKKVGNHFEISIRFEVDMQQAIASDSLTDTVSYADVYEILRREMQTPSQLLEHVAGRIIASLRKTYPQIGDIEIDLSKKHPPITGQMQGVGIHLISRI